MATGRDVPEPEGHGSRNDDGPSRGATPLPNVRLGDVLNGKYRIDEVLGVGGMGVVVAAHHLPLDERVAIKFLLPEVAKNRHAVARFLREARAAIKIKSEHVARVTDVGTLEDGTAFLVMEYLNGRDLASWVRDDGPLGIPEAVELVLQACEAIAEAHALGIVHRDLKPANLFAVRRADGVIAVRVLDFGISKASGAAGSGNSLGLTQPNDLMGSPQYMSPEQLLASHGVDIRSDIWSLGVVLYELLTGRVPFDGESVPIVCSKILQGEVAPLRSLRADVPLGLEAAVLCCLEKDPSRRFENVAELAAALVDFGPSRARFSAERVARTVGATHSLPPSRVTPSERSTALPSGVAGGTLQLPSASVSPPDSSRLQQEDIDLGVRESRQETSDGPRPNSRRPATGAFLRLGVTAVVVVVVAGVWLSRRPDAPRKVRHEPQAAVPAAMTAPPAVAAPPATDRAPAEASSADRIPGAALPVQAPSVPVRVAKKKVVSPQRHPVNHDVTSKNLLDLADERK